MPEIHIIPQHKLEYEKKLQQESQQSSVEIFEDENNIQYTKQKPIESIIGMFNGSMFGFGSVNGSWLSAVEQMGKWYESNMHTYQTGTDGRAHSAKGWFQCPLINGKVADDCSGFVQACLKYFGIDCPVVTTAIMQSGSQFDKLLQNNGFKYMCGLFDPSNLIPGDIICGGPSTHTEIYAGDKKSWSWGTIHDGLNGHAGMPCGFCNLNKRGGYINCWRKS